MTTTTHTSGIDRDIVVANFIRNRLRSKADAMLPEIEEVCERISRIKPEPNTDTLSGPYLDLTPVLLDFRGNIDTLKARYAA